MPQNNLEKALFNRRELTPDVVSYNSSASSFSRRRFLGTMGKVALGAAVAGAGVAYASSKLPRVYAQASELYCGLLSVPVKKPLDGHVEKDEWYSDTIDYKSTGSAFVTRMKRDKENIGYTYFGMDIPSSNGINCGINFYFDRKSSNDGAPGADGVYNLLLDSPPSGSGFRETDRTLAGRIIRGTPFYKAFEKGEDKDYDWKTFVGPSELNPADHLQAELKVRSDRISPIPESSNHILFYNGYNDANIAAWLAPNMIPLVSKEEVLLDLQSPDIMALAALFGTWGILTLAKPRLSRRSILMSPVSRSQIAHIR